MTPIFTALAFTLLGLNSMVYATSNSNEVGSSERKYNPSTITLKEAYERNSFYTKKHRPGLGSFTRELQSKRKTTAEQLDSNSSKNENNLRTSRKSGGISGGRNAYYRNQQKNNSGNLRRLTPINQEANTTLNNKTFLNRSTLSSREKRFSDRIYGGRNSYNRYLKKQNSSNTSGVSHFKPNAVNVNRNLADTEANTR